MNRAIYAFSGDPITFGHIDIIQRASSNFDEVIVGIGVNPDKKYMFTLEERTRMAKQFLTDLPNVIVRSFTGLLVDFAYEEDVSVIVKGVRNSTDFDYENMLHQVGESQKLGIDTFILFAKPELAHISSSVVKSIQKEHGFIDEYVPLYVKQCLEVKMHNQYILGITGTIGAGKSYISKLISDMQNKHGIEIHNIELDDISRQILEDLEEPKYKKIRSELIECFGDVIKKGDGMINRKVLGQIVFNDQAALDKLNEIMFNPLQVRLKRELYGKSGLILLNAALLAEANITHYCNNNILLITCDKDVQEKRLMERGLEKDQIKRRIESQYSCEEKEKIINANIEEDKNGRLWILDNSGPVDHQKIDELITSIKDALGIS